jgi:uncharacterized membrane protein
MKIKPKISNPRASIKRQLLKTISWRVIGTIDTFILSWFISGDLKVGLSIGLVEIVTKMIFYFLHERAWNKIMLNRIGKVKESQHRHIAKTVTWRLIGSTDTFILGWIFTGNPLTGLKISLTELFTKMILYYFHERVWYKIDYGKISLIKFENET